MDLPNIPDIQGLTILWFILVGVLWTGYLILEGFDLGVGMLTTFLPKGDAATKEKERRVLINTIGPVWDGNQVWLLTAGGATFAAFPEWYATMFSGFYLALLLILVALILRGMSFEYRGKVKTAAWRKFWDVCIGIGSWAPALLLGVAFGNLVHGVKLGETMPTATDPGNIHQYVGGFWALLNPYSLVVGLCVVGLFLLHGALYVTLKTSGQIRENARKFASRIVLVELVIAAVFVFWGQLAYSRNTWTWAPLLVAAGCLAAIIFTNAKGKEGLSFILSSLVAASSVVFIFGCMYPFAMPALNSQNEAYGLYLSQASSSNYTLTVMTIVAAIFVPIVLAYTAWTYWTFRHRVSITKIPESIGLSLKVKAVTQKAFGGIDGNPQQLDLSVLETAGKGASRE